MIRLATVFLSGGTSFTAPLTKSAEVIKQSRFQQADTIFVTDGEAHVNDEYIRYWNQLKKEKGWIFSPFSITRYGVNPGSTGVFRPSC